MPLSQGIVAFYLRQNVDKGRSLGATGFAVPDISEQ